MAKEKTKGLLGLGYDFPKTWTPSQKIRGTEAIQREKQIKLTSEKQRQEGVLGGLTRAQKGIDLVGSTIDTGYKSGGALLFTILVIGGFTAFYVLFNAMAWWIWLLAIFGLILIIKKVGK